LRARLTTTDDFKFNVACNWDPALLDGLAPYAGRINYLYGKSSSDVFSGGRAACELKAFDRHQASEYIASAKARGFTFNYLLNGTYLPSEFSNEARRRIREDFDWISDMGVEWITLSIPLLARIANQYYPHLKIYVSVFAHVCTPQQVRQWQDIGASGICLDRQLCRNFPALERLTRETGLEMDLLVNDPCLLNCMEELYHDNLMSKGSVTSESYYHYCSFHCLASFLERPSRIVASSFIRPEDLDVYADSGVRFFKITDRNRSTKFILNAVKAYTDRRYDGNLLDLFSLFSAYDRPAVKSGLLPEDDLTVEAIDRFWRDLPSALSLAIDNEKMDGFAAELKAKSTPCSFDDCDTCLACTERALKSLSFDPRAVEIAKANLKAINHHLNSLGSDVPEECQ